MRLSSIVYLLALCLIPSLTRAQKASSQNDVESLRKQVVATKGDKAKLNDYIKAMGEDETAIVQQFDAWMKQFPDSAAFPLAIGTNFYRHEHPGAAKYLKRAAALRPADPEIWNMLAIDAARWGDKEALKTYYKKAYEAAPGNPRNCQNYFNTLYEIGTEEWKKAMISIADRFPDQPEAASSAVVSIGYNTKDKKERVKEWEYMVKRFPPQENIYSAVVMFRMFDICIELGDLEKAVKLASEMSQSGKYGQFDFPVRLKLAEDLRTVRQLQQEGKYNEAYPIMNAIKIPRQFASLATVKLIKAEVADQMGNTRGAYDTLQAYQAFRPDQEVAAAVAKYAGKLNIDVSRQKADLKAAREKTAYAAPSFELGLYTADKKVKLEDYKGKVVFLTFWFPGCGPCRAEFPHLEEVLRKYPKDKVAFLGIQSWPSQDPYVLPLIKAEKYSFTPLKSTPQVSKDYKVRANPSNFIIDQHGKVQYNDFVINSDTEDMLELMINALLES